MDGVGEGDTGGGEGAELAEVTGGVGGLTVVDDAATVADTVGIGVGTGVGAVGAGAGVGGLEIGGAGTGVSGLAIEGGGVGVFGGEGGMVEAAGGAGVGVFGIGVGVGVGTGVGPLGVGGIGVAGVTVVVTGFSTEWTIAVDFDAVWSSGFALFGRPVVLDLTLVVCLIDPEEPILFFRSGSDPAATKFLRDMLDFFLSPAASAAVCSLMIPNVLTLNLA